MKILFINISDIRGGSAMAAFRLAQGLEAFHQTENYFIVRNKYSQLSNVFATRKTNTRATIEKYFNIFMNGLGLQYQYLPFSPQFIRQKTRELKPDIISLHNTLGGYFRTADLIELSKLAPIVWTMHDMWPFTANAAHTFGDDAWMQMRSAKNERAHFPQVGLNTGRWLIRQKKFIYERTNLHMVAPSRWLYNLARKSPVLHQTPTHHIYNGIDLQVLSPKDKISIRNKLGIPADAPVVMFGAERLTHNEWKGGMDLIRVLQSINAQTERTIHLLILGTGEVRQLAQLPQFVIHKTGYVTEEYRIAEYLSASDVLLYPTRADNLSNVLIEAIACGTPCVTNDVGGCKEIIQDQFNGFLLPIGQTEEMARQTLLLLNNPDMRRQFSQNARQFAEERFSVKQMAKSYFRLFRNQLNREN